MKVRVIQLESGNIVVQAIPTDNAADYTAENLPPTGDDLVVATAICEDTVLGGVKDVQCQVSILDGQVIVDLEAETQADIDAGVCCAAEAALSALEADEDVPATVKPYLQALRDLLRPRGCQEPR